MKESEKMMVSIKRNFKKPVGFSFQKIRDIDIVCIIVMRTKHYLDVSYVHKININLNKTLLPIE